MEKPRAFALVTSVDSVPQSLEIALERPCPQCNVPPEQREPGTANVLGQGCERCDYTGALLYDEGILLLMFLRRHRKHLINGLRIR